MLMIFFSEIFIFLVKCSYVFMSEIMTVNAALTKDSFVKVFDIICIKSYFLKFAANNKKFGLFLSDKSTVEYKNITGLS